MRNLKMTIAFDGSKYKGWQRQKDNDLTIQGKIEAVLSKMTEEDIQLVGCGRTDSGVHAENYIANFHTKSAISTNKMLDYLYEYLPEDIGIKSIEDVAERFHARYNVKSKTYTGSGTLGSGKRAILKRCSILTKGQALRDDFFIHIRITLGQLL